MLNAVQQYFINQQTLSSHVGMLEERTRVDDALSPKKTTEATRAHLDPDWLAGWVVAGKLYPDLRMLPRDRPAP